MTQHKANGAAPKRRRRRVLYGVLTGVGVLLLIAAVGLLWLNSDRGQEWAKEQLQAAAAERAPGFAVAEVGGFLPFRLRLEEVVLDDQFGTPTATVQSIELRPKLFDVVRGRYGFSRVDVHNPQVIVQETDDGALNIESLLLEPDPLEDDPTVNIDTLNIHDGQLLLRQAGQDIYSIANLDAQGELLMRDDSVHVTLEQWRGSMPQTQDVAGVFVGSLDLKRANGTLRGDSVVHFSEVTAMGESIGDGHLAVELTDSQVAFNLAIGPEAEAEPDSVSVAGSLKSTGRFVIELQAQRFDTSALWNLAAAESPFVGPVSGKVLVSGTIEAPGEDPVAKLLAPEQISVVVDVQQVEASMGIAPTDDAAELPVKPGRMRAQLQSLLPMHLGRLSVKDSTIRFIDYRQDDNPQVWVNDLALTLENLATRRPLMQGQPTVFTLRGVLETTGDLSAFIVMDPLAPRPNVAGQAALESLQLREIGDILAARTGMSMPEGDFTCYLQFFVADGYLKGGLQPMLRNVEVEAVAGDLGTELAAALANPLFNLFSNGATQADVMATVIPVEGPIDDASAEFLPSVLGVIENAFLAGLAYGFTHLPPG